MGVIPSRHYPRSYQSSMWPFGLAVPDELFAKSWTFAPFFSAPSPFKNHGLLSSPHTSIEKSSTARANTFPETDMKEVAHSPVFFFFSFSFFQVRFPPDYMPWASSVQLTIAPFTIYLRRPFGWPSLPPMPLSYTGAPRTVSSIFFYRMPPPVGTFHL